MKKFKTYEVGRATTCQSALEVIEERRWNYVGHVLRGPDTLPFEAADQWLKPRTRKKGRCRTAWEDNGGRYLSTRQRNDGTDD